MQSKTFIYLFCFCKKAQKVVYIELSFWRKKFLAQYTTESLKQ